MSEGKRKKEALKLIKKMPVKFTPVDLQTLLQGLIEELEERKAFLHNTDCISESLELDYVISLCKKRLEHKITLLTTPK